MDTGLIGRDPHTSSHMHCRFTSTHKTDVNIQKLLESTCMGLRNKRLHRVNANVAFPETKGKIQLSKKPELILTTSGDFYLVSTAIHICHPKREEVKKLKNQY